MAKCWAYVLQSEKDEGYYVGITSHLYRRIKEHNSGQNQSTSSRAPWKLVYKEQFIDHKYAREREKYLKSGPGRTWLRENLAGHRPDTSG